MHKTGKRRLGKRFRRAAAFAAAVLLTAGGVSFDGSAAGNAQGAVSPDNEHRKIEVWDFAEVQETDSDVYHNNIEPGFWKQSGLLGSDSGGEAQAIELEYTVNKMKTAEIGDLTMRYQDGDRIYGQVTETAFDPYDTMSYSDGYTADGLWYCNGTGGGGRRYVSIKNVEAGDKIAAYMGSYTKENGLVHFMYQGTNAKQDDTAEIECEGGRKYEFIAKHNGTYKIYVDSSTDVKPFWHRIMVVPGVKAGGVLDMASVSITGYGLKFVNNKTGDETMAEIKEGGAFTVSLTPGCEYTAVLTGAAGYGITDESKKIVVPESAAAEGMADIKAIVEKKEEYKFSGTITGFDADVDLAAVRVVLAAAPGSQRENIVVHPASDGRFEAYVESGISYAVSIEGANDYELVGNTKVLLKAAEERELKAVKRASFKVAGNFLGLREDAAVTSLKFINMADGYEYIAAVEGGSYSLFLRNGTYRAAAAVSADGYRTTTHVTVNDSAVDRDMLFVSDAKVTAVPFAADIYVGYPEKDNNYDTVREAVRACEAMRLSNAKDRITVHIAPGVYREQIMIDVPYVTFTNDEPEKEVKLTWYYGIGYAYYSIGSDGYYSEEAAFDKFNKSTAKKWGVSVFVKSGASEFRAEHITFESSFNKYVTEEEIADGAAPGGSDRKDYDRTAPEADVTSKAGTERASAIAVEGSRSEFYCCKFISSQDTLYTGNNITGYFKNCYIEGNTDYIFGGGDFVFDGCELNFFGYSDRESGGYITAAAEGSTYGYVFRNCYITGNENMKVGAGDLGRPWRASARVSFINTKLEYADIILPRGWNSMSGNLPQNANYAEYNTTAANGEKVDVSGRVTGVKTENPIPDILQVWSGWEPEYYAADTDNVTLVKALDINASNEKKLKEGDVLAADFSLGDNEYNNVSVIRWYRLAADGTEVLVKSGTAQFDRSYTVSAEDEGFYIKAAVFPETVSGYTAAEQTTVYESLVEGLRPMEDVMEEAGNNPDAGAAVEEIVTEITRKALSDKMQSDEKVLGQMKALDERYQQSRNITVGVEISEEAEAETGDFEIEMIGAAVNGEEKEAVLHISKSEKAVTVENKKLTEKAGLDVKLTSRGEEIASLKVPMTITMAVPKSLRGDRMDTLALFLYGEDGSCETVNFRRNGDNTVTFTVLHFGTFVFAKESAAPEPSPSLEAGGSEADSSSGSNMGSSSGSGADSLTGSEEGSSLGSQEASDDGGAAETGADVGASPDGTGGVLTTVRRIAAVVVSAGIVSAAVWMYHIYHKKGRKDKEEK